jgi:hypothetical protein
MKQGMNEVVSGLGSVSGVSARLKGVARLPVFTFSVKAVVYKKRLVKSRTS